MRATRQPARVAGAALLAAALLATGGCARERARSRAAFDPGAAPNVIVYLIDTLRADHLGCYGYARPTSPTIDALAAEGHRLEQYRVPCSWTRPSVASLFTGLHPLEHGCQARDDGLWEGWLTLAELFGEAGYRTMAIVANPVVHPDLGFAQGFATFRDASNMAMHTGVSSENINRLFGEELDALAREAAGQPFFAYLHSMDPHAPYMPKRRYLEAFLAAGDGQVAGAGAAPSRDPEAIARRREALARLRQPVEGQPYLAVEDRAAGRRRLIARGVLRDQRPEAPDSAYVAGLIDLYDAEIRQNDDQIGALIADLQRRGLWERTVLVVVSDHGEGFFAHGLWGHGNSLHEELVRVPAVIRAPAGRLGDPWRGWAAQARNRATDPMQLAAALADLALGEGDDPVSVNGAWAAARTAGDARPAPALAAVSTQVLDSYRWLGFQEGAWRALYEYRPGRSSRLHDVAADPDELRPVDDPARDAAARAAIEAAVLGRAGGLLLAVRHAAAGDTVRVRTAGGLRDWFPVRWEGEAPPRVAWADGTLEVALAADAAGDIDAVLVTPIEGREAGFAATVSGPGGAAPAVRLLRGGAPAAAPRAPDASLGRHTGGPWAAERLAAAVPAWEATTATVAGGSLRVSLRAATGSGGPARAQLAAQLEALAPGEVGVALLASALRLMPAERRNLSPEDSLRLDQQMRALGYVN